MKARPYWKLTLCAVGILLGAGWALRKLPDNRLESEPGGVREIHRSIHALAQLPPAGANLRVGSLPADATTSQRRVVSTLRSLVTASGRTLGLDDGIRLAAWIKSASKEELAIALAAARQIVSNERSAGWLQEMVLARFGQLDGPLGLALIDQMTKEQITKMATAERDLFESWVRNDPSAALTAASERLKSSGIGMESTMVRMLEIWAVDSPALASDYALALARSSDAALSSIGRKAREEEVRRRAGVAEDFRRTAEWIERTAVAPEERISLLEGLARAGLKANEWEGAAAALRQTGPLVDPELASLLLSEMSAAIPEQAKAFALSLPAGSKRSILMEQFVKGLAEKEGPARALAWLGEQEQHEDFDRSYFALAEATEATSAELAWRIFSLATNAGRTPDATYKHGFAWLRSDFANAARQLPAKLVEDYLRSESLLRQLEGIHDASAGSFGIDWLPAGG